MEQIALGLVDSPYLDTIIALVLIYALLSMLVSTMLEAWNKRTKARGVFLQKAVFQLLDDPLNRNFGYLIYQHPIINKMRSGGNNYPFYIPSEGFANALIDTLADQAVKFSYVKDHDGRYTLARDYGAASDMVPDTPLEIRLQAGVRSLADSEFKRLMTNFIDRNKRIDRTTPQQQGEVAHLDLDRLKLELGRWFDDYMDRASGTYKNNQGRKLRILGLLVALGLNVDSIHLTKVLLLDKNLRTSMVLEAERVSDRYEARKTELATDTLSREELLLLLQPAQADSIRGATERMKLVEQLTDTQYARYQAEAEQVLDLVRRWQLPIGWNPGEAPLSWVTKDQLHEVPYEFKPSQRAVLRHFQHRNRWSWRNLLKWMAGIGITAMSLSVGAPFWFDALSKLVNLRRSGPKPKTTNERQA